MFGASKMIKKTILNASENYIDVYIEGVKSLFEQFGNDIDENALRKVRRDYLDSVANASFDVFRVSSPSIYQRIMLALTEFDVDDNDGMMAGKVYAIIHLAYYNKIAKPNECVKLNHQQNSIMEKALLKLEDILGWFLQ